MDLDKIYLGDSKTVLRGWPDSCVQTVVTSPPYWGLRNYGMEGQMGLEPTLWDFIQGQVELFREVHRVLRADGTIWVNMGDSYNAGTGAKRPTSTSEVGRWKNPNGIHDTRNNAKGLKPKDLMGMPWRLALALQADGWFLRRDIIWAKKNPMPETVYDRPTTAHEYIFLLSKSRTYYYDWGAVREPASLNTHSRGHGVGPKAGLPASGWDKEPGSHGKIKRAPRAKQNSDFAKNHKTVVDFRNKRSVWTVGTEAFDGAHFATFPPALIAPCILAGAPRGGVVLDPFMGAGTTALVAARYDRRFLGIELNPEYRDIALSRIKNEVAQGKMF